ncbi:MAG: transaldolase family protein, partial [Phycisphaerae bacterium]
MDVYAQVARAYMDGLRGRAESGGDLTTVASVASFFVSRIDVLIDRLLEEKRAAGHDVDRLLGKAGIASARLAYTCFEELFSPVGGFAALAAEGARVQRPLWASTSTKNPAYPDTMYVDGLIGPQTVNTLPPDTIHAALDHCRTEVTIDEDLDQARATLVELSDLGIDLGAVTRQLSVEGIGLFARSFCDLLENLERKRMTLRAAR